MQPFKVQKPNSAEVSANAVAHERDSPNRSSWLPENNLVSFESNLCKHMSGSNSLPDFGKAFCCRQVPLISTQAESIKLCFRRAWSAQTTQVVQLILLQMRRQASLRGVAATPARCMET